MERDHVAISWGRTVVSKHGNFRDAMVYPNGACEWDWRKSNTHHVPGIQLVDIEFLLNNGCDQIVLSRGMQLVLQTDAATIDFLTRAVIPFFIEESSRAVELFNHLRDSGIRVGALLHSTC